MIRPITLLLVLCTQFAFAGSTDSCGCESVPLRMSGPPQQLMLRDLKLTVRDGVTFGTISVTNQNRYAAQELFILLGLYRQNKFVSVAPILSKRMYIRSARWRSMFEHFGKFYMEPLHPDESRSIQLLMPFVLSDCPDEARVSVYQVKWEGAPNDNFEDHSASINAIPLRAFDLSSLAQTQPVHVQGELVLNQNGSVLDLFIVSGDTSIRAALLENFRKWKFIPGLTEGEKNASSKVPFALNISEEPWNLNCSTIDPSFDYVFVFQRSTRIATAPVQWGQSLLPTERVGKIQRRSVGKKKSTVQSTSQPL